jgi:hypothetical protein
MSTPDDVRTKGEQISATFANPPASVARCIIRNAEAQGSNNTIALARETDTPGQLEIVIRETGPYPVVQMVGTISPNQSGSVAKLSVSTDFVFITAQEFAKRKLSGC